MTHGSGDHGCWAQWTDAHPGIGFMLGNGVVDVVAGVSLLLADAQMPKGWACLCIASGVLLVAGALIDVFDIEIVPGPDTYLWIVLVAVLLFAMTLYLTHPAEDLPRLLPGHDADSQHLRMLHGAASAFVACLAMRGCYRSASGRARPPLTRDEFS